MPLAIAQTALAVLEFLAAQSTPRSMAVLFTLTVRDTTVVVGGTLSVSG